MPKNKSHGLPWSLDFPSLRRIRMCQECVASAVQRGNSGRTDTQ